MENSGIKIVVSNKKASFNYFLSDFLEAGLSASACRIPG